MTARYFDIPFASSGDLVAVPDTVQPDGSVSYPQGYGIDYSTAVGSGGRNIERAKMNQLFFDITTLLNQLQTNSFPLWYSGLAASPGYPKFACVLYSDGNVYQSQVNTNTSVPGADANWMLFPLGNFSGVSTGDVKLTLKTTADTGWVMMNDGTIGNAASGGTTRANADTSALFTLLWNNVSNTYAPVSGGRGGSAAADYAANKTIAITKVLGRAIGISGSGSGLTARTLGQTFGEENHALTSVENATHNHTVNITDPGHDHLPSTYMQFPGASSILLDRCLTPTNNSGAGITPPNTSTSTTGITAASVNSGSGTAHNTMQPTGFMNAMIKL